MFWHIIFIRAPFVEVTAVFIKENYLIVDRGGAAYIVESGNGFYPYISIHITRWFVMNYPAQWDIIV